MGEFDEIRPRALVFDLFGEFVREQGDELRLKVLVDLGEVFGISAPTMRVMVTRLRSEGWLDVSRHGRESIYSMTQKLKRTLDEGHVRIFREDIEPWNGEWAALVVTSQPAARAARSQLQHALAWLSYGQLSDSTWVSPHNRTDAALAALAEFPEAQAEPMTMRSRGLAADRSIAERCWDLEGLGGQYHEFVRYLRTRLPEYRSGYFAAAQALIERTALIQRYRRFPFRDPVLPPELQPVGWAGDEAFGLFIDAYDALAPEAFAYFAEVVDRHG